MVQGGTPELKGTWMDKNWASNSLPDSMSISGYSSSIASTSC